MPAGSLLAGTDDSPGEVFLYQGRFAAMAQGSADRYFQQDVKDQVKLVPEGVEGQVPYRGPVEAIVHQLAGGLRAAMGYVGPEFQAKACFTSAALRESHVHDVAIPPAKARTTTRRGYELPIGAEAKRTRRRSQSDVAPT